jgi:hypothetical protein
MEGLQMSSSNLVRWGGIAAVVAGLVWIVLVLFSPQDAADVLFFSGSSGKVIFIVALLSQVTGIAGLYVLQRGRHGRIGAVGALVAFVGFAIELIFVVVVSLGVGEGGGMVSLILALLLALGVMVSFVGLALLGIAILRMRTLPSWFGVLLIVGLPGTVILAIVLGALASWVAYGIFWLLVGYVLLSSNCTWVERTTRTR